MAIEAATELEPAAAWIEIELSLTFEGPFLVSKALDKANDDDDGAPDRGPVAEGYGEAIYYLPGESLRGALRAQARRIVNTVHPGSGDGHRSMKRLFGPKEASAVLHRGALDVGDFEVMTQHADPLPSQEFVAIDRFTGGAADSRKFATNYLDRPTVKGRIRVQLIPRVHRTSSGKAKSGFRASSRVVKAADLGLLALLMRDLAEGDVPLGYGKTKGYGACRIAAATLALEGGSAAWRRLGDRDGEGGSALARLFGLGSSLESEITACVDAFRQASEKTNAY